ncbi:MAG TPA: hypothetical protein PK760_07415 [Flavobacteriales bacterium]|nr:hypothetical protein [Flavobacteriales bacterium]
MFTETIQHIILFTTCLSGAFALVQGGIAFGAKRRETYLGNMEKRRDEVLRLLAEYEKNRDAFEVIFDYTSAQDNHLRITNLVFTAEEMSTRRATDRCFEHLRNVHSSWTMGLIASADLGPWTYWVHRALQRPCLKEFAAGCGYLPFVEALAKATQNMPDIACLEKHCPWWNKPDGPKYPEQRMRIEHGARESEALS